MKDKCKSGTGIIIYLRIGMGYGCDQKGRRRYQIKLRLYLEKYAVSSVLDLMYVCTYIVSIFHDKIIVL